MKIPILSSFDMLFFFFFFFFFFFIATIVTFTYGLMMFVTDWYLQIKSFTLKYFDVHICGVTQWCHRLCDTANRIITCSYLNVLNCIEKYVNDKDRNRAKQHVWNSIDPQQMLDSGMIHLDTFLYRLDTDSFE